jgi:hypothetical protein
MAYQARDLSVLSYANGFTLWHYTTEDSAEAVAAAGYFDDAMSHLSAGDMILANTDTAAATRARILHVESRGPGGAVAVTDLCAASVAEGLRPPVAPTPKPVPEPEPEPKPAGLAGFWARVRPVWMGVDWGRR